MVYQSIQNNCEIFGLRWLLRKYNMCPNAYYNFLKRRRAVCQRYKELACQEIKSIYFHSDEELNQIVSDFAYSWYNHVRTHTFNKGLMPFEVRYKN